MEHFPSQQAALQWMVEELNQKDEFCIDNVRFAFKDDPVAIEHYEEKRDSGCCGSTDMDVKILGRLATIGCNYGH
jgi:hypothetical protein